jgi:hypothetical protein
MVTPFNPLSCGVKVTINPQRILYLPSFSDSHSNISKNIQRTAFRLPAHICISSDGKSMGHSTYRRSRSSCSTKLCMLHLQLLETLISVPRSPDPTYSRISRPCFPTKHAHVPTERISYLPELPLCAVFCHMAHASRATDLVPSSATGSKVFRGKWPVW